MKAQVFILIMTLSNSGVPIRYNSVTVSQYNEL